MIVIPAIDIRDGRCVRLVEGDFFRETVFDADPVDIARQWESQGAERIHVVDLDGARTGVRANAEMVTSIRRAVTIPIQAGGGIRTLDNLECVLESGIDTAIIGTSVIVNHDFVERALARWPERIAFSLDARGGLLATEGWTRQSNIAAGDLAVELKGRGASQFIFTDINRDGHMNGPNILWLKELVVLFGTGVIASGGVATIADIEALSATGVGGVIIGRALYDRRVSLPDAIRAARAE